MLAQVSIQPSTEHTIGFEELLEICELAVNISEHFAWSWQVHDSGLSLQYRNRLLQ